MTRSHVEDVEVVGAFFETNANANANANASVNGSVNRNRNTNTNINAAAVAAAEATLNIPIHINTNSHADSSAPMTSAISSVSLLDRNREKSSIFLPQSSNHQHQHQHQHENPHLPQHNSDNSSNSSRVASSVRPTNNRYMVKGTGIGTDTDKIVNMHVDVGVGVGEGVDSETSLRFGTKTAAINDDNNNNNEDDDGVDIYERPKMHNFFALTAPKPKSSPRQQPQRWVDIPSRLTSMTQRIIKNIYYDNDNDNDNEDIDVSDSDDKNDDGDYEDSSSSSSSSEGSVKIGVVDHQEDQPFSSSSSITNKEKRRSSRRNTVGFDKVSKTALPMSSSVHSVAPAPVSALYSAPIEDTHMDCTTDTSITTNANVMTHDHIDATTYTTNLTPPPPPTTETITTTTDNVNATTATPTTSNSLNNDSATATDTYTNTNSTLNTNARMNTNTTNDHTTTTTETRNESELDSGTITGIGTTSAVLITGGDKAGGNGTAIDTNADTTAINSTTGSSCNGTRLSISAGSVTTTTTTFKGDVDAVTDTTAVDQKCAADQTADTVTDDLVDINGTGTGTGTGNSISTTNTNTTLMADNTDAKIAPYTRKAKHTPANDMAKDATDGKNVANNASDRSTGDALDNTLDNQLTDNNTAADATVDSANSQKTIMDNASTTRSEKVKENTSRSDATAVSLIDDVTVIAMPDVTATHLSGTDTMQQQAVMVQMEDSKLQDHQRHETQQQAQEKTSTTTGRIIDCHKGNCDDISVSSSKNEKLSPLAASDPDDTGRKSAIKSVVANGFSNDIIEDIDTNKNSNGDYLSKNRILNSKRRRSGDESASSTEAELNLEAQQKEEEEEEGAKGDDESAKKAKREILGRWTCQENDIFFQMILDHGITKDNYDTWEIVPTLLQLIPNRTELSIKKALESFFLSSKKRQALKKFCQKGNEGARPSLSSSKGQNIMEYLRKVGLANIATSSEIATNNTNGVKRLRRQSSSSIAAHFQTTKSDLWTQAEFDAFFDGILELKINAGLDKENMKKKWEKLQLHIPTRSTQDVHNALESLFRLKGEIQKKSLKEYCDRNSIDVEKYLKDVGLYSSHAESSPGMTTKKTRKKGEAKEAPRWWTIDDYKIFFDGLLEVKPIATQSRAKDWGKIRHRLLPCKGKIVNSAIRGFLFHGKCRDRLDEYCKGQSEEIKDYFDRVGIGNEEAMRRHGNGSWKLINNLKQVSIVMKGRKKVIRHFTNKINSNASPTEASLADAEKNVKRTRPFHIEDNQIQNSGPVSKKKKENILEMQESDYIEMEDETPEFREMKQNLENISEREPFETVADPNSRYVEEEAFLYHNPPLPSDLTEGVLPNDLLPLPPPPDPPIAPSNGRWSYDEDHRVFYFDMTRDNLAGIAPEDKTFMIQVMERDDLTLISSGLLDTKGTQHHLWTLDSIARTFLDEFFHKFRRFDTIDRTGGSSDETDNHVVLERDSLYSMRMVDYVEYLKRRVDISRDDSTGEKSFSFIDAKGREHIIEDVRLSAFYCIDVDLQKRLILLYKDFVKNFRLPEVLPGGGLCMMRSVTTEAQPFMGPNLYITPPGTFTHFHQDGHGTVDSGHLALSGFNEICILRRLTERHKRHALALLTSSSDEGAFFDGLYSEPHGDGLGEKPKWPTLDRIEECRRMGYCPSLPILKPGQHIHINKGRLHAFRKMTLDPLPKDDCHYHQRQHIVQEVNLQEEQLCVSIAWDWAFMGVTERGIYRETTSTLEATILNRLRGVVSLAIPEFSLLEAARCLDFPDKPSSFFSALGCTHQFARVRENSIREARGILPALEYVVAEHALADVADAKLPDTHADPGKVGIDPRANEGFACAICSKELSNVYMHCQGCEKLLSKDFNICVPCHRTEKYRILVYMHPTSTWRHATINHTGNMKYSRQSRCPCKKGPVCSICHYCLGCSCTCHTNFKVHSRLYSIDTERKLLERTKVLAQKSQSVNNDRYLDDFGFTKARLEAAKRCWGHRSDDRNPY